MAPSSNASTTSVQVALRIRPTTPQDATSIPARFQRMVIHAASNQTVSVDPTPSSASGAGAQGGSAPLPSTAAAARKQTFVFDQVYGPEATQHDLFLGTAEPLVNRFLEGFNCTILAYGQTSSGKTYSMTGVDLDADPTDPYNGMGIIPRAVSTIFTRARETKEQKGNSWSYSIKGSFIELYNEDLIDLLNLDDVSGGRREVQIREDKDGHIIWGGLREVAVKNANEVMSLIRQGTAIRRTNETDMNAQSSRSHAIFSLTLTQRKYTGAGLPPRSSTPLPPGGRSPSRLARPTSTFGYGGPPTGSTRVSSPTFGRPPTPSFATAMSRGGGLRPASALGSHLTDGRAKNIEDDGGEYTTIISKFHFVDLAGSERLKRTAAQGDRIKEGISINSGLLALGNVISALGDPARAKSHMASHVPYRDSKLTRLLQDSLGGNAHTLMIACVSPAEWNAGETVNTLKYANRARNIKNRAVVTEKEDGWDDVEWLQNMVTRLRKDVKALKDGGAIATTVDGEPVEITGATKNVVTQMVELQSNYESLRLKFVERTEELTRLRRELGEKQRNSGGTIGGTGKYEEIVGPVIEEYEKTISAMEAELGLNRAALRLTNDVVEEKEHELAEITERHAATEMYVEELRSRVAKLSDRESTTEAYIRDLEEKLKLHEETSISSRESVSELKREIARYKEADEHSTRYVKDLEERLARSDESVLTLRQAVEQLEAQGEAKREEVESLRARMADLLHDGEAWRTDLEQREQTMRELEAQMAAWEAKKKEADEERKRIGNMVNDVQMARFNLSAVPSHSSLTDEPSSPTDSAPRSINPSRDNLSTEHQLVALQETHAATLADLSNVTSKYRDALREITDLASQIQELKLQTASRSESPERAPEPPLPRRRMTGGRSRESSDAQIQLPNKRHFFRQAASTESLHSRSQSQSQSLSQELFSARSRKRSFPDTNGSPISSSGGSPSPRSMFVSRMERPNLSISLPIGANVANERSVASLEKEIMRLQEVLKEREADIVTLESTIREQEKSSNTGPATDGMEQPAHAENSRNLPVDLSPQARDHFAAIRRSMELRHPIADNEVDSDDSIGRLNELMLSMAQKESQHREVVEDLNSQLSIVRRQLDELSRLSRDQAHNMSTELEALRVQHDEAHIQMESLQLREEGLLAELADAAKHHAQVVESLRQQHEQALREKAVEVETMIKQLKGEHDEVSGDLKTQLAEATSCLNQCRLDHETAFGKLKAEHSEEVKRLQAEAEASLLEAQQKQAEALLHSKTAHEEQISNFQKQLDSAKEKIGELQLSHETVIHNVKVDHEMELQTLRRENEEAVLKLKELHEVALSDVKVKHQDALKIKDEEHASVLLHTEEEYYIALDKLRSDHADAIARQEAESAAAIARLNEDHISRMKMAEIAREGSLTDSQSAHAALLQQLQDEHAASVAKKEAEFADDLRKAHEDHSKNLVGEREKHAAKVAKLKSDQATNMATLKEEHAVYVEQISSKHASELAAFVAQKVTEIETLQEALSNRDREIEALSLKHRQDTEESVRVVKEQHAILIDELARAHEEYITELKATNQHVQEEANIASQKASTLQVEHLNELQLLQDKHAEAINTLKSNHEQTIVQAIAEAVAASSLNLKTEHAEEVARLKAAHEQAEAVMQADLITLEERHRNNLEETRAKTEQTLAEERQHLSESLAELEQIHASERDTLLKARDLLSEEVMSYKSATDEFIRDREQTRQAHESEIRKKATVIADLETRSRTADDDKLLFQKQVQQLQAQLEKSRGENAILVEEASRQSVIAKDLEKHQVLLSEARAELEKTKAQRDTVMTEKNRLESIVRELQNKQETAVRELQAQLARTMESHTSTPRPIQERNTSFTRPNGMSPSKLPPITPPPSIPPPPAPKTIPAVPSDVTSTSSHASTMRSSASSKESTVESVVTSPATSTNMSLANAAPVDPKITAQIEEQARLIDEQGVMIKTLNKQLTHCEGDLQAHMELVSKFETSLAESEKNLRKARMSATELARERDTSNSQVERLRMELEEARRNADSVRRSITEEKLSLELRLEEERRARERTRVQMESRVDALQRRKSKFVCM